jgi:hypothetical protein
MPAVTEDTGRVAPKAPPSRLWWIMLARAAAVMGILARLWAIVGGTIMLVDALALRRMGRVFGQAQG